MEDNKFPRFIEIYEECIPVPIFRVNYFVGWRFRADDRRKDKCFMYINNCRIVGFLVDHRGEYASIIETPYPVQISYDNGPLNVKYLIVYMNGRLASLPAITFNKIYLWKLSCMHGIVLNTTDIHIYVWQKASCPSWEVNRDVLKTMIQGIIDTITTRKFTVQQQYDMLSGLLYDGIYRSLPMLCAPKTTRDFHLTLFEYQDKLARTIRVLQTLGVSEQVSD